MNLKEAEIELKAKKTNKGNKVLVKKDKRF